MRFSKDSIRHALREQRDEITALSQKKFIERDILAQARGYLEKDWIKVIMGIRRCGKSILAHQILESEEYGYINFDDERLVGVKAENLNDLLQFLLEITPGVKKLFFDEIQNVEGWELFANRLHRQGYNLIITGSNSKLLSKELATHLTGRFISIELSPFSFREFLKSRGGFDPFDSVADLYSTEKKAELMTRLEEFCSLGGFPELVMTGYEGHYLRELFDKIITRDIAQRYSVRYVKTLKELALYGFANQGGRMTYLKTKNIFEIKSVHTVKNYYQYLEDTYLLSLLPTFSFKVKEQIRQPRKFYSVDNGLCRALSSKLTNDLGAKLENLVFQELNRRHRQISYALEADFEIDFVLSKEREVTQLIQVCFSLEGPDTKKRELKALLKGARTFRCEDLLVITWDEEGVEEIENHRINILPVWKWLLSPYERND